MQILSVENSTDRVFVLLYQTDVQINTYGFPFSSDQDAEHSVLHYWGFQFYPEYEGFYAIGDDEGTYRYPLYLKKGDRAGVCILKDSACLEGKNTDENEVLYAWERLSENSNLIQSD